MSAQAEATNLAPIVRPDGSVYRPRALRPTLLHNEDEITGVVVFGTHDAGVALPMAHRDLLETLQRWGWDEEPWELIEETPSLVWWTRSLSHFDEGQPWYFYEPDPERGAAGVAFDVEWQMREQGDDEGSEENLSTATAEHTEGGASDV